VRESATERKRAAAGQGAYFEGKRGPSAGLRYLEVGVDVSRVDHACDAVLYSEFKSMDACAYAPTRYTCRREENCKGSASRV
jgi:hypothetical protein